MATALVILIVIALILFLSHFLIKNLKHILIYLPYVPGALVAIGLAFTMYNIRDALKAINFDDKNSFQTLITSISDALLVSLLFIIASVFAIIYYRVQIFLYSEQQEKENAEAYDKPEITLHNVLLGIKENNEVAKQQIQELEKLNQQTEKNMQSLLQIYLKTDEIVKYAKQQGQELDKLNQQNENHAKIMEQYFNNMESFFKEMKNELVYLTQGIQQYIQNIETQFNGLIDKMYQKFNILSNKISEDSTKGIEKILEQQNSIGQANMEKIMNQNYQTAMESMNKLVDIIRKSEEILAQAVQKHEEILNQNSQKHLEQEKNISDLFNTLMSQNMRKIDEVSDKTHDNIGQLSDAISNFGQNIEQSFTNVLNVHIKEIEKFFELFQEWNRTNKAELAALQQSFGQMLEKQNTLNYSHEQLAIQVQETVKELHQLNEQLKSLIVAQENIENHTQTLQNRVADVSNSIIQLDNLNEKLGKIVANHVS
jgi:hypothetical protein